MKILKNRIFAIFLLIGSAILLIAGCTSNEYRSCATLYIKTENTEQASVSSSNLIISNEIVESYEEILYSEQIQNKINSQYPNDEYTLTLEVNNQTSILVITASSQKADNLEEICNMAVSLFSESITQTLGYSCRVVDPASPAQLSSKK